MRIIKSAFLLAVLAALPMFGQLAIEQKEQDFRNLAAMYAKRYAPLAWKQQLFGTNALNITQWLERVRASKSDLEFLEICLQYVGSLQDIHSQARMTSTFRADSGLRTDIYDGKVLIEGVVTSQLPPAQFPIRIGDELLAIDGRPVNELIDEFAKAYSWANPLTTRRANASLLTFRSQTVIPRLPELPAESTFQILHQTGVTASYRIPWVKTGEPILSMGPVPTPGGARTAPVEAEASPEEPVPDYMKLFLDQQNAGVPAQDEALIGFGSRTPSFAIPGNFTIRRGLSGADNFFSANYTVGSRRIGYIRIPNFGPASTVAAITEFANEIAFFEQNTDGLIVDVMRNNGGNCGYMATLLSYLHRSNFTVPMFEARVTQGLINAYDNSLRSARAANAQQWIIDHYAFILRNLQEAYAQGRGMTGPLPRCTVSNVNLPATANGVPVGYSKPLIVLIDEFSVSAADFFSATIQDNRRGPLVGIRTSGAGGTVNTYPTGFFSETSSGVTESLGVRDRAYLNPGYPSTAYIENVGVHPDIYLDYMTRANLLNRGLTFVQDFTGAIINEINRPR